MKSYEIRLNLPVCMAPHTEPNTEPTYLKTSRTLFADPCIECQKNLFVVGRKTYSATRGSTVILAAVLAAIGEDINGRFGTTFW